MYTVPIILAIFSFALVLSLIYFLKTSERFTGLVEKNPGFSKEMINEINQIPQNISKEVFIESLEALSLGSNRLVKVERIKPLRNVSSFFAKEDGVRLEFDNGLKLACTINKPESFLLEMASEVRPEISVLSIEPEGTADLQVSLGQPPLEILVKVAVYHPN